MRIDAFFVLLTLVSVRFERRGEWSEDEFWEGGSPRSTRSLLPPSPSPIQARTTRGAQGGGELVGRPARTGVCDVSKPVHTPVHGRTSSDSLAEELDVDDLVEEHFVGGLVKEEAENDGAGLLRAESKAEEGDEDEGELKDREKEERMILQRHGRPDRCNAQAGGLFRRDGCVPCLLPPPSLAADGMWRRESTSRRGDAGKRETDRS
jgi:hypothetical protein